MRARTLAISVSTRRAAIWAAARLASMSALCGSLTVSAECFSGFLTYAMIRDPITPSSNGPPNAMKKLAVIFLRDLPIDRHGNENGTRHDKSRSGPGGNDFSLHTIVLFSTRLHHPFMPRITETTPTIRPKAELVS